AEAAGQDQDTSGGGDAGLDRTEDLGEPGPGGDGGVEGVVGAGGEVKVMVIGEALEEGRFEQASEASARAEGESARKQGESGLRAGVRIRRHGAPRLQAGNRQGTPADSSYCRQGSSADKRPLGHPDEKTLAEAGDRPSS